MSQSRQTGRSAIALLAGLLAVVILSLGTDAVMHAIGVLPPMGQPATGPGYPRMARTKTATPSRLYLATGR